MLFDNTLKKRKKQILDRLRFIIQNDRSIQPGDPLFLKSNELKITEKAKKYTVFLKLRGKF